MKTYTLKRSQTIPLDREVVFEFFKKPENLSRLTPASLDFKILTPFPIKMEKGKLIDYTIKVAGIRQRWTTLITEYEPPHRFVDEQIKGPYSFWHHTHTFEACDGGTKVTDEVRYSISLGFIGRLANFLFVRRQLESIFKYREKVIQEYFDGQ